MFEKNYFVCKHFQAVPEATTQLLRMVEREAVEILTELLPAGVVPQLSSFGESGSESGSESESESEEGEEEAEHDSIAAARTVLPPRGLAFSFVSNFHVVSRTQQAAATVQRIIMLLFMYLSCNNP